MNSLSNILERFGRYESETNTLFLAGTLTEEITDIANRLKFKIQLNLFGDVDTAGREGTDSVLQEGI